MIVEKGNVLLKTKNLTKKDLALLSWGLLDTSYANAQVENIENNMFFMTYSMTQGLTKKVSRTVFLVPVKDWTKILTNLLVTLSSSPIFPFDFQIGRAISTKIEEIYDPSWLSIAHETYRKLYPAILQCDLHPSLENINFDTFAALLLGIHRYSASIRSALINQYITMALIKRKQKDSTFKNYLNDVAALLVSFFELLINSFFKSSVLPTETSYAMLHRDFFKYLKDLACVSQSPFFLNDLTNFFNEGINWLSHKIKGILENAINYDIKNVWTAYTELWDEKKDFSTRIVPVMTKFVTSMFKSSLRCIFTEFFEKLRSIVSGQVFYILKDVSTQLDSVSFKESIDKIVIPIIVSEQINLAHIILLNELMKEKIVDFENKKVYFLLFYSPLTYMNDILIRNKVEDLSVSSYLNEKNANNVKIKHYVITGNQPFYNYLVFNSAIKKALGNDRGYVLQLKIGSAMQYFPLMEAITRNSEKLVSIQSTQR